MCTWNRLGALMMRAGVPRFVLSDKCTMPVMFHTLGKTSHPEMTRTRHSFGTCNTIGIGQICVQGK